MRFSKFGFSTLLAIVLACNIILLSNNSASAQGREEVGGELTCKWAGQTCTTGVEREVCLSDGDGNSCTCGTVTRPC